MWVSSIAVLSDEKFEAFVKLPEQLKAPACYMVHDFVPFILPPFDQGLQCIISVAEGQLMKTLKNSSAL